MWRKLTGLFIGPISLITFSFWDLGRDWGGGVALVIIVASAIYIPLFLIGVAILGSSLIAILVIANGIPLGYLLLICGASSCDVPPKLAALIHFAATFCAILYWGIAARKQKDS